MRRAVAVIAFICLMLIGSLTVSAAPDTVAIDDAGTVDCIIIIKKPETAVSSTTKKSYPLSAVSLEGVNVFLYRYDPAAGSFALARDANGAPVSTRVGASGLYLQQVELEEGMNYLLIRAEYTPELYQNVRVDIKLLDQSIIESIKGFSASFQSMLGGWLE